MGKLRRHEDAIGRLVEALRGRHQGAALEEWLRRPETTWEQIVEMAPAVGGIEADHRSVEQVVVETKYAGYIRRQTTDIEHAQRHEAVRIPDTFNFLAVPQLRTEAREKLSRVRPRNLGQAGRISGITPADLAVLMLYLKEPGRMVS